MLFTTAVYPVEDSWSDNTLVKEAASTFVMLWATSVAVLGATVTV